MENSRLNLRKIPVSILTGFLGSGKTTLLNSIIKDNLFKNTLLIINEFGKISIDHHLIQKKSDDKIVLKNGCLCCNFSGDLVKTLDDALKLKKKFNRIIVETSGLADPVPIIQTIVSDQIISGKIKFSSLITTVDTVNFQNNFNNHLENFKQIVSADKIILTKTDISETSKINEVKLKIKKINPNATIQEKNKLKIFDIKNIFSKSSIKEFSFKEIDNQIKKNKVKFLHDHNKEDNVNKVNSISLKFKSQITKEGLKLWMNALARFKSNNLLRMKGIVKVEGKIMLINSVQKVFHEPQELKKTPFKGDYSQIVFITKGIADTQLKKTLEVFKFRRSKTKNSQLKFTPGDYKNFVKCMNQFDALKALDRF